MGVRLLKKMGWREGQGIGPKMSRRALEKHKCKRRSLRCFIFHVFFRLLIPQRGMESKLFILNHFLDCLFIVNKCKEEFAIFILLSRVVGCPSSSAFMFQHLRKVFATFLDGFPLNVFSDSEVEGRGILPFFELIVGLAAF